MSSAFSRLFAAFSKHLNAGSNEEAAHRADFARLEDRILYSAAPLDLELEVELELDQDPLNDSGLSFESMDAMDAMVTSSINVDLAPEQILAGLDMLGIEDGSILEQSTNLVVIDGRIPDIAQLLSDHGLSDAEVLILDSNRDGIEQISAALTGRTGLSSVHIVSHGRDGAVRLGSTWLTAESLSAYAGEIAQWGISLASDADLLFYGCNLAATENGEELIESLASLCGCDVAASDDLTGHASLGGDWELEYTVGSVDVNFNSLAPSNWQRLLATYTVTNTNATGAGSLEQAILDSNTSVGVDDVIDFNISTADPGYRNPDAIPGNGDEYWTIRISPGGLPYLLDTVILDATTQPGYAGNPVIELDGTDTPPASGINGIALRTNDSTVKGFIVHSFGDEGIEIDGSTGFGDNNLIENNWVGLDGTGAAAGVAEHGIMISVNADNNIIRNNISADNGYSGLIISDNSINNVVEGNYVGVGTDGVTAMANGWHGVQIQVSASGNLIGGTSVGAENVIAGNTLDGILIDGSNNNDVQGNFIGTDYTGTLAVANGDDGVDIKNSSTGNTVGGNTAAHGNTISGNTADGVYLESGGNTIIGNYIGTDVTGTLALGNGNAGVRAWNAGSFNQIGSTTVGEGNVVAYNSGDGIELQGTTTDVSILGNSMFSNGGLGIDLNADGMTANDAGDGDGGANDSQNTPVFTTVSHSLGTTTVNFDIDWVGGAKDFHVEFYASDLADRSGSGEGQTLVHSQVISHTGSGSESYIAAFSTTDIAIISATATEDFGGSYGNTSEFTALRNAQGGQVLVVDTNIDVKDGMTTDVDTLLTNKGADGKISLREAIEATNATVGAFDIIQFDIGSGGLQTIVMTAVLPNITDAVYLDATTQSGYIGAPLIELDGTVTTGSQNGITLSATAAGSTVKGFIVHSFGDEGIEVLGDNNTVQNNWVGLDSTGLAADANGGDGIILAFGAAGNLIGGSGANEGNVVAGNTGNGISLRDAGTDGNFVYGNLVGVGTDGVTAVANGMSGIWLSTAVANNFVGGTAAGQENVASGNTGSGILVSNAGTGNTIAGNLLGTDQTGLIDVGNDGYGIDITNTASTIVGGNTAGHRNVISGNTLDGISLSGATTTLTTIQGNYIGLDVTGAATLANSQHGVDIASANNTIGGTGAGEGNVISGNTQIGVNLTGTGATDNQVLGNLLGTDATGTVDLGNTWTGVSIATGASNNDIGDGTAAGRNIISGNQHGISIGGATSSGNRVLGNFIGTDITGTSDLGNDWQGINAGGTSTIIGGVGAGNVISGNNSRGIYVNSGTGLVIQGNYIGTNAAGSAAIANNEDGINITSSGVQVGGTAAGEGNVISGNAWSGISLTNAAATGNTVQGNTIGLDATGTIVVANGTNGVHIAFGANGNTIGGTVAGARNVISGNTNGVYINGVGSDANTIQGNYIGTDITGTLDRGNSASGVYINGGASNVIDTNVISGNDTYGIFISGASASGNLITGNLVGLNAAGTVSLLNGEDGIYLNVADTTQIGGNTVADRNVINAAVGQYGIFTFNATSTTIGGNYLGTDNTGTVALAGGSFALNISGSSNTTIGGTTAADANVIAGYTVTGINIDGPGSLGTIVEGNYIGSDVGGTLDLTTGLYGIALQLGATGVTIGGTAAGAGNTIAYNGTNGVRLMSTAGSSNAIRQNQIYNNGGIGIDLEGDGISVNDLGDGDSGANGLMNFAVIYDVHISGPNVTVTGEATAGSTVEFFKVADDGDTHGEAAEFIGSAVVVGVTPGTVDPAARQFSFVFSVGSLTGTDAVTATVTDLSNNTSEFSVNVDVNYPITGITDSSAGPNVVLENAVVGATVGVTAFATDPDTSDTITYSLDDNDGGRFAINSSTGVVTVNGAIDREADGASRNITVRATSSDTSFTDQVFVIAINPVNDHNPIITSDGGGASAAVNVAENSSFVSLVTAGDADLPAESLTYSISGGVDAAKFAIDSVTGVLAFVASPDFETPTDSGADNVYDVIVEASDGTLTDTQTIAVTVTDSVELVSVDNSTSASIDAASSLSFSHTVADNDNRMLIVSVAIRTDVAVSTVTYDGTALTLIGFDVDGTGKVRSEMWGGTAPAVGTANVVVTMTGSANFTAGATDFFGVDQTISYGSVTTGNGTGDPSLAVASAVNELVIDAVADRDVDSELVGSGQSLLIAQKNGSGSNDAWLGSSSEAGTGSVTMSWTTNGAGAGEWAAVALALKPFINADPVITSNGGGVSASVNVTENSTAVTTVSASDADLPGQTLTYSIMGGIDAAKFSIVSGSGELTFVAAPDFESPTDSDGDNVYDVVVQVSDGIATDFQAIAVTVTDFDEFDVGPVIDTDATANAVDENATVGTLVGIGVAASDADATNNTITYSLVDDDGGRFAVNVTTGVVTVNSAIDREADGNSRNVTVRATSSDTSFTDQVFAIAINDVDEFDVGSVTDSDVAADEVNESAPNGSPVGIVVLASDADATDSITYSLDDTAGGRFAINAATGMITVANTSLLDYETLTSHDVTVRTTSADASFSTAVFIINLLDDTSESGVGPVSDSNAAANSVAENALAGTTVGITAFATDLDITDTISYSLDDNAGGRFAINAATGVVTLVGGIDAESATSHNITVRATSADTSFSTAVFAIAVTDVDEFDVGAVSDADGTVDAVNENATVGANVGVTAFGQDMDVTNNTITYSLQNNDGGRFTINPGTGVVALAGAIDREADGASRNITLRATSSDGSFFDQVFVITVNDVDEFDIGTVTDTDLTANVVDENAVLGTTVGITASASDLDATNNTITYALFDNDGGRFSINSSTGDVTVAGAIDREVDGAIRTVTVRATSADMSFTDQVFAIAINDVDEFDVGTVTDTDGTIDAVNENATLGTVVGIDASASDADATNNTITFSLQDDDGGRFTINSSTGVVTVNGVIDREADGASRNITVRGTSSDLSFTDQVIAIAINDVDEFDVGAVTDIDVTANAVHENAAVGTTIGITASASDADATTNTITYSLQDSDGGRFAINSSTGVVTVAGSIDREADGASRNITVRASGSDGSFTDQAIAININDIDEFDTTATVDVDGALNSVDENAAIGTVVGITASAADADATNNTITYSLDDNDGGRFAISATTGVVTVAGAIDREADGASRNITIRSTSNDSSFTSAVFAISVNDVDEFNAAVPVDADPTLNFVNENVTFGTTVGLTVISDDLDAADTMSYSLDDSAGGRFAVNGTTGVVTVSGAVDHETAASHNITVRAISTDGSFATQVFTINVGDVNEAPVASGDDYSVNANDTLTVGVPGVVVNDFDVDGNPMVAFLVTPPVNGSATLLADGTLVYTPAAGFFGTDTIQYRISDGALLSNVAAVQITVNPGLPTTDKDPDPGPVEDSGGSEPPAGGPSDSGDDEDTLAPLPTLTSGDVATLRRSQVPSNQPTGDTWALIDESSTGLGGILGETTLDFGMQFKNEIGTAAEILDAVDVNLQGYFQSSSIVWQNLDFLRDQVEEDIAAHQYAIGTATLFGSAATVGYVVWTVRGGFLMATFMSSLPAWRIFDPLPVLKLDAEEEQKKKRDESLAELAAQSNVSVH